jgi:hypothetical protein
MPKETEAMKGYLKLAGWRGVIGSFVIWATYFVVIYVYLSIGCAKGLTHAEGNGVNSLTLALFAITLIALAGIALVGWNGYASWRSPSPATGHDEGEATKDQNRFTGLLAMMTSCLALLSAIWVAVPMLMLSPCQ